MSEILSEAELDRLGSGEWRYVQQFQVARLIASHRALRTERNALKDDLATILKERNDLAMRCDALKAELAAAKWAHGDFDKSPCFICGYGGAGYYQPSMHPCAEEYHRRKEAQP